MVKMTHSGAIFSEEDKIELAKAKLLNDLENNFGYDPEKWITLLKRAERSIKTEPTHTAIQRLLAELERGDH